MSILEEIGERAIGILYRCFYYFVGFFIWVFQVLRRIKFYPYFERRGIEARDYLILKAQVSTLVFVVLSIFFAFNFLSVKFFFVAGVLSGGYSLFLAFVSMKEHLGRDVAPYQTFFLSFMGISPGLMLVRAVKPVSHGMWLLLFSLVYVGLFWVLFRKKYGRDYTFGKVLEGGSFLKVKVNYDICAGVKPGVIMLENKINASANETVKLKVSRSIFSLKGNRVTEATAIVK